METRADIQAKNCLNFCRLDDNMLVAAAPSRRLRLRVQSCIDVKAALVARAVKK